VELEQQLEAAEEYNKNLHEEVHRLNNKLNPLLPHDNDEDEDMDSRVFMAEGDDNMRSMGHRMPYQKKKKEMRS
jgi:hypothetical protein